MRRAELVRSLARVPEFDVPDPAGEQVTTPPEIAADLLEEAARRGDVAGRSVVDLGCGTGRLAIGAALLVAGSVEGIDQDARAIERALAASTELGVSVEWVVRRVGAAVGEVDTVVMNPPFGAQRRGADRPFWAEAFARASRIYAFALAESRTFIERSAVERAVRIEEIRPVRWPLPRTFPHHRKRQVDLRVDRWILAGERRR